MKRMRLFLYLGALTVVWVAMALAYYSWEVLPLPPGHIHGWRQSDCVSLTRNFYEDDLPVWAPRVHYAKEDLSGRAVGEFPIVNYITAKLMKITGYSWTTQRAVVLFFGWLAILGMFLWLREEFAAELFAFLASLVLFTSPIFVYYSCNYLPDVPSVAFAAWALWADARYRRTDKLPWGLLAAALVCMSVLVKISGGVIWVALLFMLLLRFFSKEKFAEVLRKSWPMYVAHALVGLILAGWYMYAHDYDYGHKPMIFLTHIRPYWETNPAEFAIINSQIFDYWAPHYFHALVWWVAGFAFVLNFWLTWKNRYLFWLNLLVPLGFFAFLVLMYKQLYFHDYYLVVPMMGPAMVIGIFVGALWTRFPHKIFRGALLFLLLAFVGRNALFARAMMRFRYFDTTYNYVNYDLEKVQVKLREKGIPRTDLMIVLPDNSPNNTLVLVDQYGFTGFQGENETGESLRRYVDKGVKWLTITDTAYLHKEHLKPFTRDTFLRYNDIHVFQLQQP